MNNEKTMKKMKEEKNGKNGKNEWLPACLMEMNQISSDK